MSLSRVLLSSLLGWGALSIPRLAAAQRAVDAEAPQRAVDPEPEPEPYFYKGYNYGSQALYGPLWVFLNRGYDVLQDRNDSRNIFEQEYRQNAENVARNLLNPFPAIADRGWDRFLSEEIFPLSYGKSSARWVPNYTLHLIGGGVTYTGLTEWFRHNHVPAPRVFSIGTMLVTAFLNETLENKGATPYNTDAIADFYFFDIGGIILFSFAWPNVLFSKYLMVADWSSQPAFTYPGFDLHNQGNYFSLKFPVPFYSRLRLFAVMGLGSLFGLSYQIDSQYSISVGGGSMASRLIRTSDKNANNEVEFAPAAGIFLDRNNSLLASLKVTNVQDYFLNFNLYPNAITVPGLGMWAVVDKGGHFVVGLSFSKSFGVGLGIGKLEAR